MTSMVSARSILAAALAAAITTACGAQSDPAAALPSAASVQTPTLVADAAPKACKGQKTSKTFATVTEAMSKKGGALCIPAFGGFGGTLVYPGVTPAVKATLVSSTSGYSGLTPGSGTPSFYLLLTLSASTAFSSKVRAGGGLTGKKIAAKSPYTAFPELQEAGGFWHASISPCYAVAKSGKYGGVFSGMGALFKGQSIQKSGISAVSDILIIVYPGQQAGSQC
ncbi:MAG TPA: hypothetical protein VMF61_05360 [Candidatus Acidoferrales bacterium]|nr:hypothetical protein [Candidatus Acidoferrales bacterium]